ncbi:unnamed protein product [Parajaminaea phylloscopi]
MSSTQYSDPATPVPTLKILLIGSSSVGKSSLLLRFTEDEFLPADETSATIGIDYKLKSIVVAGKKFKLSIWDTAGQERFRTLTSSYYRGAQGVIVVYDVTSRASFDALPAWFNELETFATTPDVVKCVVGNKVDKDFSRVVTEEEGKAFAESRGAIFVEASAKKGTGVKGAFDDLVDTIISTPSLWESQPNTATRPGDRLPGGYGSNQSGTLSLAGGVQAARDSCSC